MFLTPWVLATLAAAQIPLSLPVTHGDAEARQAIQLKEELEFRKLASSKDPLDRLGTLPETIREYATYSASKGGVAGYAASFDAYIKGGHPDPKIFDLKLKAVQDTLRETVPTYYQTMFNVALARTLLKRSWNTAEARSLAESAVAVDDRHDCLEDDRFSAVAHAIYTEKKEKRPLPFSYHNEDGEAHCRQETASRYALLGKIQVDGGMTEAGGVSFRKSLQEHSNADAALGLAAIDRAKGDRSAVLDLLIDAQLTGALPAGEIQKNKALYIELHPGNTAQDYDTVLDQRYAKSYINPVKDRTPTPQTTRPEHVALEELFTGADCEPCIAPDLATDAVLNRYTRDQVVVAIYHDNAPGPDPLTTTTSEVRAEYYGTGRSTPHVFLDGKELTIEEGPRSHAQDAFEMLNKSIDPLLADHAQASLKIAVHPDADLLQVKVTGQIGDVPPGTHLQILLLEDPMSYSGRNTMRFHPMVVRARAGSGGNDTAIAVRAHAELSQTYVFDLKKVETENLAYYGHFKEEIEKRMSSLISSGNTSKANVDAMAEFREQKNSIHRDRLAVVAFLQADESKHILQTSFASVERSPESKGR